MRKVLLLSLNSYFQNATTILFYSFYYSKKILLIYWRSEPMTTSKLIFLKFQQPTRRGFTTFQSFTFSCQQQPIFPKYRCPFSAVLQGPICLMRQGWQLPRFLKTESAGRSAGLYSWYLSFINSQTASLRSYSSPTSVFLEKTMVPLSFLSAGLVTSEVQQYAIWGSVGVTVILKIQAPSFSQMGFRDSGLLLTFCAMGMKQSQTCLLRVMAGVIVAKQLCSFDSQISLLYCAIDQQQGVILCWSFWVLMRMMPPLPLRQLTTCCRISFFMLLIQLILPKKVTGCLHKGNARSSLSYTNERQLKQSLRQTLLSYSCSTNLSSCQRCELFRQCNFDLQQNYLRQWMRVQRQFAPRSLLILMMMSTGLSTYWRTSTFASQSCSVFFLSNYETNCLNFSSESCIWTCDSDSKTTLFFVNLWYLLLSLSKAVFRHQALQQVILEYSKFMI